MDAKAFAPSPQGHRTHYFPSGRLNPTRSMPDLVDGIKGTTHIPKITLLNSIFTGNGLNPIKNAANKTGTPKLPFKYILTYFWIVQRDPQADALRGYIQLKQKNMKDTIMLNV